MKKTTAPVMKAGIVLKRFISQECVQYSPELDRSEWHMKAEFSDGQVYETAVWLKANEEVSVNADWKVVY